MPLTVRAYLLPLAFATSAGALADSPLTEDDFFAPLPTVLTASRLAQPLTEAPVALTVIDREMIRASSAIDVVELLRLVPGFQVARKEGIDSIATFHGFADDFPRRMQVLVDGRSVYDPGLNGVVWSALPVTLNQIERIEVVRGSNAAAYGSNAVLGTINIITRSPETSDRLNLRTLSGGSHAAEGELSHAGVAGGLAYRIDASRALNSGFDNKDDDSASSIVTAQGLYRPTLEDTLTLRAGLRETDFDSEAYRYPRDRLFKANYQQLTWNRVFDRDEDLQLQVYRNAFRSPDAVDVTVPPGIPGVVDYSLESERYDLELQHRWRPGAGWRVSWGAGYRWDSVEGALLDTDDELTREQLRAFGNAEWRVSPGLVLNAGLMAEHYSDLGDYYSPRLSANWLLDARQTLRLGAARAHRIATFIERRGELTIETALGSLPVIVGSSTVAAERVDSLELGYLAELPRVSGAVDVRAYHYEIDPVIDGVDDDAKDRQQFLNAGSFDVNGIEVQLRLRPVEGSLVHLAYAYADAGGSRIENINPIDPADGVPESNDDKVPEHTLTALVSQRLPGDWQASATYSYVSEMTWMGEGEDVDGRGRLDLKLSKRFRQPTADWLLSLNVHNLFDDTHYEFAPPDLTIPIPGNRAERRLFVQVEYLLP